MTDKSEEFNRVKLTSNFKISFKVDFISVPVSPKIIGRVNADPDYLPRTQDFGLNVTGFLEQYYSPECPLTFLPLAALCCDMEADLRYDP